MKNLFKKTIGVLVALLLFTTSVLASDGGDEVAQEVNSVPTLELAAKSGILFEQSTGTVLFEKNAHEKMPMASITKIMTMLLAMEALENGRVAMTDMVSASANAVSMGGTQIWLKENEQMTFYNLLKACAVASANDAAMAIAEHIGGSEEGFVGMMNNKAAELKMNDTTFMNPTGLDAEGHCSTAYDIALMSCELLKYPAITEFTSIWMDTLRDGKTELVNTNKLVRFYKGCTGLKTGTTDGAGSCLSASATRDDLSIISVVMGCTTSKDRFDSARKLLDYGFATFTVYNPSVSDDILPTPEVKEGVEKTVRLSVKSGASVVIEKTKVKSLKQEINITPDITAPIEKGEKLGVCVISAEDEIIAEFPIVAADSVAEMTVWRGFASLVKKLFCI